MRRAAVSEAPDKGDDHPCHRRHGSDGRCANEDPFAMLSKNAGLRLCLTVLGPKDQFPMQAPAEIRLGLNRHQDAMQLLSQVQQRLHLIVLGEPPLASGLESNQLVGVSCQDLPNLSPVHHVLLPASLSGRFAIAL
jgi:hypothetical protein